MVGATHPISCPRATARGFWTVWSDNTRPEGLTRQARFSFSRQHQQCYAFVKRGSDMEPGVLSAIQETASIPSMPAVAVRFIELCDNEDREYDDLVDVLSADAGMASEILRLANSPFFGVPQRIGSLKQAMTLLGLIKLRSLVVGRYLIQQLEELPCPGLNENYLWRRSITTAVLAVKLSEVLESESREEALIAGLLTDVGVIVLAGALLDRYERLAAEYEPLDSELWAAREEHLLGVGHAEVSAMVLAEWNLPEIIVQSVGAHHRPQSSKPTSPRAPHLPQIVATSSTLAQLFCGQPSIEAVRRLLARASETTGLAPDVLASLLLNIEDDLADLAHLLRIGFKPRKAAEAVARELALQATSESDLD